jgi:hypothetical protein
VFAAAAPIRSSARGWQQRGRALRKRIAQAPESCCWPQRASPPRL